MTGPTFLRAAMCAALLLGLAACGGPRGDWRTAFGATTSNPHVLAPALPLMMPPSWDLPPPGGINRATPGR